MNEKAPESIFLKACHPASPNHNCTWRVNKGPEDSVEYVRADLLATPRSEAGGVAGTVGDVIALLEEAMQLNTSIGCSCNGAEGEPCSGNCPESSVWRLMHKARKKLRATAASTVAPVEQSRTPLDEIEVALISIADGVSAEEAVRCAFDIINRERAKANATVTIDQSRLMLHYFTPSTKPDCCFICERGVLEHPQTPTHNVAAPAPLAETEDERGEL